MQLASSQIIINLNVVHLLSVKHPHLLFSDIERRNCALDECHLNVLLGMTKMDTLRSMIFLGLNVSSWMSHKAELLHCCYLMTVHPHFHKGWPSLSFRWSQLAQFEWREVGVWLDIWFAQLLTRGWCGSHQSRRKGWTLIQAFFGQVSPYPHQLELADSWVFIKVFWENPWVFLRIFLEFWYFTWVFMLKSKTK